MMRILWLDRAEGDIDELFEYLLERDPRAALPVYDAIRTHVAQRGEGRGYA